MILHVDLETRSELDLKECGLDVYAHHPSTEILMCAYAFDQGDVQQWQPRLGPMPEDLRAALTDPTITKIAWNVPFEFALISVKLGLPLVFTQWFDPMALSRSLGYPGALDIAAKVLKLSAGDAKSKDGRKLINMFSKLSRATKHKLARFKDWDSDPEEWLEFLAYNRQDVVAEREVFHRLQEIGTMSQSEYRAWVLDHVINEHGVPVDTTFVDNALLLSAEESESVLVALKSVTQLANPNSPKQMKDWAKAQGVAVKVMKGTCLCGHPDCTGESLDKDHIAEALKRPNLPANVRQVFELKQRLGGSAVKKLQPIKDHTRNGILRGAFVYYGSHTGRWSSWGVQLHNLLRPTKRVKEDTPMIVDAIRNRQDLDLLGIPVIEAVSGVLRASFRAPDGQRFMIADRSQIESRVLAWLAPCPAMLDGVYRAGLCAYKSFACEMFKKDYAEITAEERQRSKPVVLGAGFGMGSKRLKIYADGMAVELSEEEAENHIRVFRETYPEIVMLWENVGAAAMLAVQNFAKYSVGRLHFDGSQPGMLRITLPSGRALCYPQPAIIPDEYNNMSLVYEGVVKKQWFPIMTRGSRLVENIVQATARDILLDAMLAAHKKGFRIVLHCHDEMMAQVPNDSPLTLDDFNSCMTTAPAWADGLPRGAEGFESPYYRK
jgi:DNA polymerase bacteriophage-type